MDKNDFLGDLSQSERTDFGKIDFAKQPEPQQVFSAVRELEIEVENGGFDQYFRESDSITIAFAPIALRAIGAKSCAKIVEQVIEIISPLPPTQNKRNAVLDALGEKEQERLESLDDKFFEYPDDLTELLFAYVARHPEAFGPIPKMKRR